MWCKGQCFDASETKHLINKILFDIFLITLFHYLELDTFKELILETVAIPVPSRQYLEIVKTLPGRTCVCLKEHKQILGNLVTL